MARLRLSPTASVVVTARGVVVRSDLGTLELGGPDVGAFVSGVLPLLDGTRTLEELAGALPGYRPDTVVALLRTLVQQGVIEAADDAEGPPWRRQERWLARFGDAEEALDRLARARVVMAGLEPWGAAAARELANAGVGRVEALDDEAVSEDDLLATRAWSQADLGRPRAAAFGGGGLAELAGRLEAPADLVVVALPGDALRELDAVARGAHARGVRSVYAHLEGTDAVVGPAVLPGVSACWNCTRLRRLAHAPDPAAAHELQVAALAGGMPRRDRSYLAPAAGLLGHLLALEVLKLLTGYAPSGIVGRQLVQSLVTLETTRHTIVRMPWCDVCGGPGPAGDPPGGPALDALESTEDVRRALEGWADERTGVIASLQLDPPDGDLPELPNRATAVAAAFADGRRPPAEAEVATGKGITAAQALIGAAGEAVERYSAARWRVEDLRRARADELDGDVLDPRSLCLYEDHQYERDGFPFDRYDPDRALHWTLGRWVDTGEPVWAPALPSLYRFEAPAGERFCQVTSNGLAAGAGAEDAALRATLEMVERDAFTLSWLARLPGRVVEDASLGPEVGEALRELRECGAEVELRLLSAGIPLPTIACLGLGDGERWPGLTISLSCHPSPRVAAAKAILEHGHVGPHLRRLARSGDRALPASPEDVRDLIDHALYYVPPGRRAPAGFLLDRAEAPVSLGDLPAPEGTPWEACRAALAQAGVRVAIVDVTAPDVATGPFRVARALGVDVQPIHFGHGLERGANPRLQARLSGPLNREPHPLA